MADECTGLLLFKNSRSSIITHQAQALILLWRHGSRKGASVALLFSRQAAHCNSWGASHTFQLQAEFCDAFVSVFKVERKVSAIAFKIQMSMFM